VHATREGRQAIVERIERAAVEIAAETGLDIRPRTAFYRDRLDFSPDLLALTETTSADLGYRHMQLPTLTAHDALSMHHVCPVAIVFVPCRDGISHSEREWCDPQHAIAGARVLLNMALQLAEPA
jgi:N-carbamoyl-L-amino-acid hydrolase